MAAASLLLALLLAEPAATRLDAALEVAGQEGTGPSGGQFSATGRGVDVTPSLAAFFGEPGVSLSGTYAPRLLLRDNGAGVRHTAALKGTFDETRNLQLVTSERANYGRNDFAWDPGATHPFDLVELIAPVISDNLLTDTEAGFNYLPARGLALNLSAGYAAYGGLSAASQRILPLQHGPQLYAGLDAQVSRTDTLATELYAAQTSASNGNDTGQVRLSEGFQRALEAGTRAKLSAGASVYRSNGASHLSGTAALEVEHDLLRQLSVSAAASYGPHQNPLTAQLLQRAELSAAARYALRDALSLRLRGAAANETGALGSRFVLGALDASYRITRELSFSAGAETAWQHVPAPADAGGFRVLAFTAFDYHSTGLL